MPIDNEQWRAQTGLFYASRTPLTSPKCNKPEIDSASKLTKILLAVILLVLRIGASYTSNTLRQVSSVLSLLPSLLSFGMTRSTKKKLAKVGGIIGLLALTLIAVQMLLIMAGDVEQNPGPETPVDQDIVHFGQPMPPGSGSPVPLPLQPTMVQLSTLSPSQEEPMESENITENSQQETTKTQKSGSKRNQGIKRKRSQSCGVCPPCQIKEDCGECENCRDKPKNGGKGTRKQKCLRRQCKNMVPPGGHRSHTLDEFLQFSRQSQASVATDHETGHVSNEARSSPMQNLCPVENLEEQSSSHDIAEPQIQAAPQRSSKQCKTLLEKALEEGFINTHITKVLINGPPGVGKSSLLRHLLGELMPDFRDSTDIAALGNRVYVQLLPTENDGEAYYDRPLQMGMVHADGDELYNWNQLDTQQQEELLAKVIAVLDTHSDASDAVVTEQPELDQEESVQPNFGSGEATQSILQHLEKCKAERNLSTLRFLCFMDTGGQPHFLEILPAFVRNTSVNLVVFKLNKKLNYQPKFEYYKQGVRLKTRNSWLEVTNEQMIEQTTRTLLSCMPKPLDPKDIKGVEVDNIPNKPKMMLIGTFKDKVDKCTETPEDKNKQLWKNDTLKPVIDNGIMIASDDGLIFQVDASKKGRNTSKSILDEIKQKILKKSGSMVLKIPTRWYLLQLELMRAARNSQWKLLNIEECYRIGVQLGNMTKEEVLGALKYFNELNIFLYYPEVMPEAIFCDPQHLVRKVSDLIVASFPGSGRFLKVLKRDLVQNSTEKVYSLSIYLLWTALT